jgi:hypothetical protein
MSLVGTNRTNRAALMMSVDRGRPEGWLRAKPTRLTVRPEGANYQ